MVQSAFVGGEWMQSVMFDHYINNEVVETVQRSVQLVHVPNQEILVLNRMVVTTLLSLVQGVLDLQLQGNYLKLQHLLYYWKQLTMLHKEQRKVIVVLYTLAMMINQER